MIEGDQAPSFTVSFAASAITDLEAVGDWYESQGVPDVARSIVLDVITRAEQLSRFPEMGRIVPEFEVPWLRELIMPPFRLVYRIDKERVRVVRVWRSERLMEEP